MVCWTSSALSCFLISDLWIFKAWYCVNCGTLKLPGFEKTCYFYWEGDLLYFAHLSCLSSKISHCFIGIITLIFNLEREKRHFTLAGLTRNHRFHWFSLCAGRGNTECHISSRELKYCRTVLQTKHPSSSPSTRKNRSKYHKEHHVYSSLHPIKN